MTAVTTKTKMDAMKGISQDHPLMVGWQEYRQSEQYARDEMQAKTEHVEGSLWSAFVSGWLAYRGSPE